MLHCTNCGEKTSDKKICKSCGVKLHSTHNFCCWCGTALEQNAKKCPNCGEKVKQSLILFVIIKYIIGILLLMSGLGTLKKSIVTAISLMLFGIILLPIVKDFIRKLTCKKGKIYKVISKARIILLVILLLVAFVTMPPSDTNNTTSNNSNDVSSVDGSGGKEVVIKSGQEALTAAKKYVSNNKELMEQKIAAECGFKTFYSPKYSTYDDFPHTSSWTVYVKGIINGYTDDYGSNLKTYNFTVSISVSKYGDIKISSVDHF
jgi:predicted nucleic acid-binding Zn ribbon protein